MGVSAFADTGMIPVFAPASAATSGTTTIVAAVSNRTIRVVALNIIAAGPNNIKWQSHATGNDLTGLAYLSANGGYILPFNPIGWFQAQSGEALDLNLSASTGVGGHLTYVLL